MSRHAGLLGWRTRVGAGLCGLLVLAAVSTGSSPAATAAGSACKHASARPGVATASQLRKATLCLINKARDDAGVAALSLDSELTRMAKHHTRTMLGQDCLKHRCTGELSLKRRLKRSGYVDGAIKWAYAEDLGYESTPKQMVNRWLNTTLDAHNLLSDTYAHVGIAPGSGAPEAGVDDSSFVTYTLDLGWRQLATK